MGAGSKRLGRFGGVAVPVLLLGGLAAQVTPAAPMPTLAPSPMPPVETAPTAPAPAPAPAAAEHDFAVDLSITGPDMLRERLEDSGQSAATAASIVKPFVDEGLLAPGQRAEVVLGYRVIGDDSRLVRVDLASDIGGGAIDRQSGVWRFTAKPSELTRVTIAAGEETYWAARRAGLSAGEAGWLDQRLQGVAGPRVLTIGRDPAERGSPVLLHVDAGPARRWLRWPAAPSGWLAIGKAQAATFVRPTAGGVSSGFGLRFHPILNFLRAHQGVDFRAAPGAPVVAAASGVVVGARWAGGYGRQVTIRHDDGLTSSYAHLSGYTVAAGQRVEQGSVIGLAGASGLATGPHLHFEMRRHGVPVDPLRALGGIADPASSLAVRRRLERLGASA